MSTTPTKRRLLVCTIARNARPYLDRWFSQLLLLEAGGSHVWEVFLAVAENDSTDGTDLWLQNLPANAYAFRDRIEVSTLKLGTQQYASVWNEDRLRNLANARQRCLDIAEKRWGIGTFEKIAYVEPDVTYCPSWCHELIFANHPRAAGLGEPDIYSGWSVRPLSNPKESVFLYDTCATRQTDIDTCWDFQKEYRWRETSLIQTNLAMHSGRVGDGNCLHRVWSTFSCFCVYNAKPFVEGARWGYVNHRLNTGQQYIDDGDCGSGWLDADTSVMCETFRARGYNGVYLNTNCLIRHA